MLAPVVSGGGSSCSPSQDANAGAYARAMSRYPFVPKTNAQLVAGQFWSIHLSDGRFAGVAGSWLIDPRQVERYGRERCSWRVSWTGR